MAFSLTKNTNYGAGVQAGTFANTSVVPYSPGANIVTIPQPGTSTTTKLIDATQQSATTSTVDSTISGGGNFVEGDGPVFSATNASNNRGVANSASQVPTYGPAGNSKGYSILGE
jgi:hypothetical protein